VKAEITMKMAPTVRAPTSVFMIAPSFYKGRAHPLPCSIAC
jgi:hypothetical protein